MGSRNFAARLADLERLEAESSEDSAPPSVATMDDDAVRVVTVQALRSGHMYCWHDRDRGKVWICGLSGYRELCPRVQPWIDARVDSILQAIPPNNDDGRKLDEAVAVHLEEMGPVPPDLSKLDEAELLWECFLELRAGYMKLNWSTLQFEQSIAYRPEWVRFYQELAERAQPLLDALPRPLVPLATWEVADVIEAIDAGHVTVRCHTSGSVRYWGRLGAAALAGDDEDLGLALIAVNKAAEWLNMQVNPNAGPNLPYETIADWRAWLAGQLDDHARD